MGSFITELASINCLSVTGEQKEEYLHGQLTINTKDFKGSHARIGAHCDFKGKMWSSFFVCLLGDEFSFLMPEASAQNSYAQLKKYAVFSRVDIVKCEDTTVFGAYGSDAKQTLEMLFPDINDEHMKVSTNEFGYCITFNDSSLRYLCALKPDGAARLRELAPDIKEDASEIFTSLEIQAGIPMLEHESVIEEFVPQMLNLQALNAIDFDKGCYMGQEVVARTKFLGKNKRAAYILQAKSGKSLKAQAGDIIEKAIGDNWRRGGSVIRCAQDEEKTYFLAVLPNDIEISDMLRLKDSQELLVQIDLPYSLSD